jgi:hypothetical protein
LEGERSKQHILSLLLQVTGSGKTLAFVIPIIEILIKREDKLKKMQVRFGLFSVLDLLQWLPFEYMCMVVSHFDF